MSQPLQPPLLKCSTQGDLRRAQRTIRRTVRRMEESSTGRILQLSIGEDEHADADTCQVGRRDAV